MGLVVISDWASSLGIVNISDWALSLERETVGRESTPLRNYIERSKDVASDLVQIRCGLDAGIDIGSGTDHMRSCSYRHNILFVLRVAL